MRIGIFGDSFANWDDQNTPRGLWWEHFGPDNDLSVYAVRGSSVMFSAMMLEEFGHKNDINIWCVTSTSRFSRVVNDRWVHFQVTGPGKQGVTSHIKLESYEETLYGVVADYYKYLYSYHEDLLQSRAVVDHLMRRLGNVMIIPCFSGILDAGFCLNDVSRMEWQHYFPDLDFSLLYNRYSDLRPGHITAENQKILYQLISQDLKPGIFQTDVGHFQQPTGPVEKHFKRL